MTEQQRENFLGSFRDFDVLSNFSEGLPLGKFNGYYLPVHLPLNWSCIYNFDFRKDDIILVTPPKCGTHWIYYMLYLLRTRNFGEIPRHQQRPLLEMPFYPTQLKELTEMPGPRLFATHLPPPLLPKNAHTAKVIYSYRNMKDVAVSKYYHYINMVGWPYSKTFPEFLQEFMRGETFFGPDVQHYTDAWKAKNEQGKPLLIVRYEDFKTDIRAGIRRLAAFIDETVDDELVEKIVEATSVAAMRKNEDVNGKIWQQGGAWKEGMQFIRKGETGSWREHFTDPQLLAEFDDYVRQNLPAEFLVDYE